jgi:hypothetical protein
MSDLQPFNCDDTVDNSPKTKPVPALEGRPAPSPLLSQEGPAMELGESGPYQDGSRAEADGSGATARRNSYNGAPP